MTGSTVDTRRGGGRSPFVRSGVDIVANSSFRTFDPEVAPRIKRRVFTDAERTYCEGARNPAQHYAVRWAAKEAFVKVVGGLHGFEYDDVGVAGGSSGPRLALGEPAAEALQCTFDAESVSLDVSLSHDRNLDAGIAQIVAVGGVASP